MQTTKEAIAVQKQPEQKVRMQQSASQFSKIPIKPNMTAITVAMKHHQKMPTVFSFIEGNYSKLESARKTLTASDLSDNQKIEKLASVAKKVYGDLSAAIEHYQADLVQHQIEFETNIKTLSKPKTDVEAIQQASWTGFLLNNDKPLSLIASDPKLAAAALELPSAIQKKIGINESTLPGLREVMFPGYLQEVDKYTTLVDNVHRLKLSLESDVKPLFESSAAIKAINQHESINSL